MPFLHRHASVLPGLRISLGAAVLYLGLLVVVPLIALLQKAMTLGLAEFVATIVDPRVVAALRLSFGTALIAATLSAALGLLMAWVLVRYEFPGRALMDALIDLPFALPTAVAGIALTSLYAPQGWFGSLLGRWGIQVAYTPLGIVVALVFIGLPFTIRTLQPVLSDLEKETEEAASLLGASRWQSFCRVIFPALAPALITGFTLALARSIGEYGSVVFIAGNMPLKSEIAPLLIITKLEQYEYAQAAAIATVLLLASLVLILAISTLQHRWHRKMSGRL
jgi:sulfate/thiosulfate transport system permease protein